MSRSSTKALTWSAHASGANVSHSRRSCLASGDDADNDSAYFDQLEDELASRA